MPESRDEQVDVLGALSVLGEGALSEGDGAHPATGMSLLSLLECLCPYLHLSLFLRVSGVLYPPLSPAPSARMSSSSGVAPPVIRDLIRVSAFWLK